MYYQKQKRLMIVIAASLLVFIVLVCSVSAIKAGKKKADVGEEEERYLVTVYKSTEGLITCEDELEKEEDDNKLILQAKEGENIVLDILPDEGKLYSNAEVMDEKAGYILLSEEKSDGTVENEKRISFIMPAGNVTVNVNYINDLSANDEKDEAEDDQEEEQLYHITVQGMTKKIEKTYRGYYDEEDFVRAIGNWFGMISVASDYYNVTKATFTDEKYDKDTENTVSHYLYFNDDKEWKILATFDFTSKTYQFVDIRQREKEEAQIAAKRAEQEQKNTATPTPVPTEAAANIPSGGSYSNSDSPTISDTEPQQESYETEESIALSISNVSSIFLEFVGSQDVFHEAVSEYLFGLGFTGRVNGKFEEFTLDEEKGEAHFVISLGKSGAVYGTYDRSTGAYGF